MLTLNSRTLAPLKNRATLVVVSGALILSAAMGTRQTFGLFIGPFSFDRGMPVTLVAFAIALHNLVWGVAQPFAGAAADRYGSTPVVAFGATAFAAGLALAAVAPSGAMLVVGMGLLVDLPAPYRLAAWLAAGEGNRPVWRGGFEEVRGAVRMPGERLGPE